MGTVPNIVGIPRPPATRQDPIARLEAWRAAGKFREWQIHKHRDSTIDVKLGNYRRSMGVCESSLSAAVDAAIRAWEE